MVRLVGLLALVASRSRASVEEAIAIIEGRIYEPTFRPETYSVKDYGALGDGTTNDVLAFSAAIDAANAAGGGSVVTEAGSTYILEGPLNLKSNCRLMVNAGTTLKWSSQASAHPTVLTKFEGTEVFNYSPLVRAYLASNVSIVGVDETSVLDGGGDGWFEKNDDDAERLREMGNDSVPVYSRIFGHTAELPPNFIEAFGAEALHLENLTITNSPFWTVHPVASRNVICRNLIISTTETKNSDGIDPEGTVDMLIEGVSFDTGDDAVAVKAGRDADGWKLGRPSRNIIVRGCHMSSKYNALCVGSEVSGGVDSIYFYNNVVQNAEVAIYFKSNLDRGSFVRNVHVWDIRATGVGSCITFTNQYHGSRGGYFPTDFQDFNISNLHCQLSGDMAISAVGVDGHPIANVVIQNVTIDSAQQDAKVEIEHVKKFDLADVVVDGVRIDQNYTTLASPSPKIDAAIIDMIMRDDDDFHTRGRAIASSFDETLP